MVEIDAKIARVIAPLLGRVLIVDSSQASARMLAELLQHFGLGQVWTAATTAQGYRLADEGNPQLIFTEFACDGVDGVDLTRRIRRSGLPCRKAPVIMVTAQATPASITAARDCGVHEFLRKPFNYKDLMRRLEAVAVKPREWIEAVGYVGPDRRRFNSGDYKGARRRRADVGGDPHEARIVQALKIVKAALDAIEDDRPQAFRALNAQAAAIQNAAAILRRPALVGAAHGLQRRLGEIRQAGELSRQGIEVEALALLAYLPADVRTATRPAA